MHRFIILFIIFLTTGSPLSNAQQNNYVPDPAVVRKLKIAEEKYAAVRDVFYDCIWREIELLSKANEPISTTAESAIVMCGREKVRAQDAFGAWVNMRFTRIDGKYDYGYVETFEKDVEKTVRALVVRYRALTR